MAQSDDNEQERSQPASARRLERAREEGRTARSRELATFAVLLAGGAALAILGPQLAQGTGRLLARSLRFDHRTVFSDGATLERLGTAVTEALLLYGPLLGALALAALAGSLSVGGWMFAAGAASPDFGRLNPARGLSNLFSVGSVVELCKALVKACLVVAVALLVFDYARPQLALASRAAVEGAVAGVTWTLTAGFLALAASLALVAAIDVPFVLWRHARDLRMTLRETRDEARESEGDPQIRMRVRSLQREMARKRMMTEVPKADVVVTNPAHYAVALAYHAGMRAPRVVAKGAGQIALSIRRVAHESGVAVLESPPLARALYRHAALGAPVPHGLYDAVAQVLAWVYQVRGAGRDGAAPAAPGPIEVPAALAVPEDGPERGGAA
ncbi:MAG: EscU/YscU/HrcU family type III secretion system export apparatus switch protein [Betaproteobacteria bacterium]